MVWFSFWIYTFHMSLQFLHSLHSTFVTTVRQIFCFHTAKMIKYFVYDNCYSSLVLTIPHPINTLNFIFSLQYFLRYLKYFFRLLVLQYILGKLPIFHWGKWVVSHMGSRHQHLPLLWAFITLSLAFVFICCSLKCLYMPSETVYWNVWQKKIVKRRMKTLAMNRKWT